MFRQIVGKRLPGLGFHLWVCLVEVVNQLLGSGAIVCGDGHLASNTVRVKQVLVRACLHQHRQRAHPFFQGWGVDSADGNLIALIRSDQDDLLADVDVLFFRGGVVNNDFALAARCCPINDFIGLTHLGFRRVIHLQRRRTSADLVGLEVLISNHDIGGFGEVDRLHGLVVSNGLDSLTINGRGAFCRTDGRVHVLIGTADGCCKRRRQRISEHERARNKRGAKHHRQHRQRQAQFMRDDIAHGDGAHGCTLRHL